MKDELIKLIGKIDFKDEDVNIYYDLLKDVNNIDVSWQMRNPSLVSYPEDVVIPEQTEYDREYLPKFIFTGQDTITKEFITKVIDKLNYGFYERNIGEQNYLLCNFNDKQFEKYYLDNVESCINKLNDKINKIGVLFGESKPINSFDITLQNASHSIKNLTFKDNKVYGDVKILNTPMGKKVFKFIDNDYTINFLPRLSHKRFEVTEIFTFDIVF